jgi:hypothetical protein
MEAVSNGIEDKLVDALSFKLTPGASYVTDRRSVTFHPQGSNIYESSNGVRLIRIALNGDNWLDPSTFRIAFDLANTNATTSKFLRPLGGPHAFFKRCRVLVGGQVIEDVSDFNRVSQMMQILKSKHSRQNEMSEGFGSEWSEANFNSVYVRPTTYGTNSAEVTATYKSMRQLNSTNFKGIAGGDYIRVLFKPLLGIFNQPKFLPIRYAPMVIELELVSNSNDPIYSSLSTTGLTTDLPAIDFTTVNTSTSWQIRNVEAKCDLITLDNALDNSYAQHLLSGKSLPINYQTFVSQLQTIENTQKPNVNISRALTRLKSVFVTLVKDQESITAPGRKDWNTFFSPMSAENASAPEVGNLFAHFHEPDGEFKFQLQIGSKLYPEYPIVSHSESFYQLKKTLGVHSSDVHSFDINSKDYRDNKLILAIDTEKMLEAGYTGLNTRSGDLMSVKYEALTNEAVRLAQRMHIVLHSDQIMEIRDSGVQVFD